MFYAYLSSHALYSYAVTKIYQWKHVSHPTSQYVLCSLAMTNAEGHFIDIKQTLININTEDNLEAQHW